MLGAGEPVAVLALWAPDSPGGLGAERARLG